MKKIIQINLFGKNIEKMSKNDKTKTHIAKTSSLSITELQNVRIIQKNLLYVIGLSARICDREVNKYFIQLLMKKEYFGQYGKIKRLVVNNSKAYNPEGANGPSFSAYVSFSTNQECSLALLSIDNTVYDGHILKASFGSTKYCLHYLRNIECINKDCLFLHNLADEKDIINKDETNNKNIFLQNQYLAMKICDIFNPNVKSRLIDRKNITKNAEFPSPHSIFSKEIISEAEQNYKKQKSPEIEELNVKENLLSEKNEKKNGKDDLKLLLNRTKNNDKNKNMFLSSPGSNINDLGITSTDKKSERKYSDGSSISSERTFITDNPKEKKKSIYSRKFKSRFDFCQSDDKDEGVNIPEYISGIISFKCSTHYYFKHLDLNQYIIGNKIHLEEFNKLTNLNKIRTAL